MSIIPTPYSVSIDLMFAAILLSFFRFLSSSLEELEESRAPPFSAGAVAYLQKPISAETLEASWSSILGSIPEAPGLEDLDSLYPEERVKVEADIGAMLPDLPQPLPALPLPDLPELPGLVAEVASTPKKKSWKKRGALLLILLSIAAGAAYYLGYLSF